MRKEQIHICQGRWCSELGSSRILDKLKNFFKGTDTDVVGCKCLGYCEQGVNAMRRGRVYHELTEENAIEQLKGLGRERRVDPVDIEDNFLGDI